MKEKRNKLKESMLIDYLLVLLFVVVNGLLYAVTYAQNDFAVQYLVPLILVGGVSFIFGTYLVSLVKALKNKEK